MGLVSLLLVIPSAQAQTVADSVLMERKIFYAQWFDGTFHNCSAGIYAIWPDFGKQIVDRETSYSEYSLVATEDQFVPRGFGETLTNEQLNIVVPEGFYGHNPQLSGGRQGSNYEGCGKFLETVETLNSGVQSVLNGAPFRITDWYAVFSVPDGTPIAAFKWEQTQQLNVAFDASFESEQSREVEVTGNKPVVTYEWDFGDQATGSGATPNHVYSEPGTYQVTLTVTDDDGETDTLTRPIQVRGTILQYTIFAEESVAVKDTLGVTITITNVGTVKASTVSFPQSFVRLATFPESDPAVSTDAQRVALRPVTDTTLIDLDVGQTKTVSQFYLIDTGATARIDNEVVSVPVDWESRPPPVSGVDENGFPASVRNLCEVQTCNNTTRIFNQPLSVNVLTTRVEGESSDVPAGLRRWTSDLFVNGLFWHLIPVDSEFACNSGCTDLEITVTDTEGAPIEGADVELSRVLLDSDAAKGSIVTPEQGGGIFCVDSQCSSSLKLPPTDSEGKQKARFWVPGVIGTVNAFITATATKEGFNVASVEVERAILPTRAEVGLQTVTPTATTMTGLTAVRGVQTVGEFTNLPAWCKWFQEGLANAASDRALGVRIEGAYTVILKKVVDSACGGLVKKYLDEEFARESELVASDKFALLDAFNKLMEFVGLYWFQTAFDMSLAGTGQIVPSLSAPFFDIESDFAGAVKESVRAMAWQHFTTGALPTITLDLYETSHKDATTDNISALYFSFKTAPDIDPKVGVKKLIKAGYDPRIFLTQEPSESALSSSAVASDQAIVLDTSSGKRALQDSTFDAGHILVIDPGLQNEERVQVVSVSESTLQLSLPLVNNHDAGARVVYIDSLGLGVPTAPYYADGFSGLPGTSRAPTLTWNSPAPALSFAVEVATDTLFTNTVQTFTDLTSNAVVLDSLLDRTRYYWRVAASNLDGQGEWSERYSFFTGRPIGDDLQEAIDMRASLDVSRMRWHIATTAELNEQMPSCGGDEKSTWFSYTPATSGRVALETFDTAFNTVVSVWTGAAHPLAEVACNDDYLNTDGALIPQSYVEFDAEAGTPYFIRVSGASNEEGLLVLTVRMPTQVSTEDEIRIVPDKIGIDVYPNPFSNQATLSLDQQVAGPLQIEIYDILARRIAVLAEGDYPAGVHTFTIDAEDLSDGIYMIRVHAGDHQTTQMITVVR